MVTNFNPETPDINLSNASIESQSFCEVRQRCLTFKTKI